MCAVCALCDALMLMFIERREAISSSVIKILLKSLQGRYACVMSLHSDIQDDMHWLSWLRHQAQV